MQVFSARRQNGEPHYHLGVQHEIEMLEGMGKLLLGVAPKLQTCVYHKLLRTGRECGVRTLVRALRLFLQGVPSAMKPGGGMLCGTAE